MASDSDRYPFSPRIRTLRAILGKLYPELEFLKKLAKLGRREDRNPWKALSGKYRCCVS